MALSQNTVGTTVTVNVAALQPGFYLVKAYNAQGSKTIKIVKE